jgi:hypothetical protein
VRAYLIPPQQHLAHATSLPLSYWLPGLPCYSGGLAASLTQPVFTAARTRQVYAPVLDALRTGLSRSANSSGRQHLESCPRGKARLGCVFVVAHSRHLGLPRSRLGNEQLVTGEPLGISSYFFLTLFSSTLSWGVGQDGLRLVAWFS